METLKISLAAARVNAGMTQNQVAKVLKVSNKTILNWENGKTAVGYAQATMLSSLYGIPIDNIFLPNELTKS